MEQDVKKQRRFYFWFIIISLLLHFFFFWFLFFLRHYNETGQLWFQDQKELQATQEEISANNATVIFEEEPAPETPTSKPMEWTSGGLKQPEQSAQEIPLEEELIPQAQPDTQKDQEQEAQAQDESTESEPESTSEPAAEPQEPTTLADEAPVEKKVEQKKQRAEQTQKVSNEKLTLASLAKGFLNKLEEKGEHLVNMIGNKKGNPTADQIKYERYFQKIDASLKSAMRIHRYKFDEITQSMAPTKTRCIVTVCLNRNGRTQNLSIAGASNIRVIDEFLLFLVKEASSAFPPVPKYITEEPLVFSIHFPIEIVKESRSFGFARG